MCHLRRWVPATPGLSVEIMGPMKDVKSTPKKSKVLLSNFLSLCLDRQVNLKEQGQLRCQDEFIVWCGRRKYLRHVFLFEDLILFSKTKKIDGGYDIYIYKQSYKV